MRNSRDNGLFADVPDKEWNDWKWQLRNRITNVESLKKYVKLTEKEEEGVKRCLENLRMAITPYYLSLIDLEDENDPVSNTYSVGASYSTSGPCGSFT